MRVDDRPYDRQADPEAVRFGRDEGVNSVSRISAGTPGPVSRTETSTSAALTSLLIVTRRRAGGVSAIASMAFITRFTSTCCRST